MSWFFTLGALVWIVIGIGAWASGDKEATRYAFIMFWIMVIMVDLREIRKKLDT